MNTISAEQERLNFIGRIQEQRQFNLALRGLLNHHQTWSAQPTAAPPPPDDTYTRIFLLHGIGGIGKSWLTRRCLDLARAVQTQPPILTLYDDVSVGAPVLKPADLLNRLLRQFEKAGFEAALEPFRQLQTETERVAERVARYRRDNRSLWQTLLEQAAASGQANTEADTISQATAHLVEQMQQAALLPPAQVNLFLEPAAAQAAALVAGLADISLQNPLIIALDNLEIVVSLEPFIRDELVLPTIHLPLFWILSGRYNLADERIVELNGQERVHKGYRDLLGENPPLVWDMSAFGDADLRDYLEEEAQRRDKALTIDDPLIAAVKATSGGVPLVVEMVADALFTLDRAEFLQNFVLDDKTLLPLGRLEQVTTRFLRYCLTSPEDMERVQAMALLRRHPDPAALEAVWNLPQGQNAAQAWQSLHRRYAFIQADGLHDAVYDFVRRQLHALKEQRQGRDLLASRAVAFYKTRWLNPTAAPGDPAALITDPAWQESTRALLNALLWVDLDEAICFFLPRFVEGLGFDRTWAADLLHQFDAFLALEGRFALDPDYADLLPKLRAGLRDTGLHLGEPGQITHKMVRALLPLPLWESLHAAILHLWAGLWLAAQEQDDDALEAYLSAREHLPPAAAGLGQQLGQAFFRLSRRLLWPTDPAEPEPSDAALQAAQQAAALIPDHGPAWYNLGTALESLERPAEAIEAYEKAVELAPKAAHFSSLGDVLAAVDQPDEARRAYQQAIELDPHYPWPYHGLADLYSEEENYEAAASAYRQALERHPRPVDQAAAWDSLGNALTALEQYPEAIEAYRQALKLTPTDAVPWYSLGTVLAALNRPDEAIEPFRRAIELEPAYAWSYHQLGLIFEQRGEYSPAMVLFQQAAERHADDAGRAVSWNSLGDVYSALDRATEAIEAYRRAIKLNTDFPAPWSSLGREYSGQSRHHEAVNAYRQVVSLTPAEAPAWYSLGNALSALGRYDEAIEAFREAINLAPDLAWPYNNLGYIFQKLGRPQKAIPLYRQAIDRHPNGHGKAISWDNLGNACRVLNNLDEAIEAYQAAARLDPEYPWPYHNLAQTYSGGGRYEAALPLYRQAIERHADPLDQAASWSSLGDAYRALDRLEEAIDAYQQVIELNPQTALPWFSLGDIYRTMPRNGQEEKVDRSVQVIEAYRRAIELDPDFAWAYHNLGLLYEQRQVYDEALRLFRQAIDRHAVSSDRAVSWTKVGDVYRAQNRHATAVDAYRQAAELDPAYPWPYQHMGQIYAGQWGKYESAVGLLQQAVDRHRHPGQRARACNQLGDTYWALNRYKEAIDAYRQAIELDPAYARPWNNVGDVCRLLDQPDEAIDAYRRAIELDPAYAWPYHSLGLIYSQRGGTDRTAYEAAIILYRQAIERHQNDRDRARAWNNLGSTYRSLGRYKEAIKAYRQAIELDPQYTLPWQNLGHVYQALSYAEDAIEAYRQAVTLDPDDAQAWNSLGDVYRSQGQLEPATEAYRQAIRLNATYAWPYFSLGLVYAQQGQNEAAIPMLQEATRHFQADEDRAVAWRHLGDIFHRLGRTEKARSAYQWAIEFDPGYAWPYHHLGLLYEEAEDFDTAASLYQQAIKRHENDRDRVSSWHRLGDVCHALKRHEEAIEGYQHVLELDSEDALAWNSLGTAHTALEHYEVALKAFEQAIELDPDYAWPYHNLGYVYEKREEFEAAIVPYRQAIDRHQNQVDAAVSWNNLGNIFQAQEKHEEAIAAYRRAIELRPTYALPWDSLGDVYRSLNQPQEAMAAYEQAIQLDPGYAWPYHNLAVVHSGQQSFESALALYENAIERHVNNQDRAVSWNNLGKAYHALGRLDDAIGAYGRAIELDPAYGWSYNNLGVAYARRGAYDTAINLYRQAIERHTAPADQAVSWDNLGSVLFTSGKIREAEDAYRQALTLNGDYAHAWHSLGNIFRTLERYGEAIEAYQQASRADAAYALPWHGLGDVYRALAEQAASDAKKQQLNQAINAYRQAIERDGAHPWPFHSLAAIYEERGDLPAARTYYGHAVDRYERDSQKAVIWYHLGNVARRLNQPDEALTAYRQAIALDANYAAPWHTLGNLHAELGRYSDAMDAYRQAIELDPVNAWSYHQLGLVYEKLEDYEAAVSLYEQALERHQTDKDRAAAWNQLGGIYHQWGRFKQALSALQQAARLHPAFAGPWNSLGAVYKELNQPEQAIAAYQKAIELDPADARPYNNLGFFYEQLGRYDEAITLYRQVIDRHQSQPDQAVAWNNLGNVYRALGRTDDAVKAYRQAINLDPDYTWPYHSLGAIFEDQGKIEDALAMYQQATSQFQVAG